MASSNVLIGNHFAIAQVNHSDWAERHGVANVIPNELLPNAQRLAEVLDFIWDNVRPFGINSWYRCPKVNDGVGGSKNPPSAHIDGRAADLRFTLNEGETLKEIFDKIKVSGVVFDKLIIERDKAGSTWIHVQIHKQGGTARMIALQAEYNHKLGKMEYRPA